MKEKETKLNRRKNTGGAGRGMDGGGGGITEVFKKLLYRINIKKAFSLFN